MFGSVRSHILLYLNKHSEQPPTITQLSKDIDKSYSMVFKQVKLMEKQDLLFTLKDGRDRKIQLTRQGVSVAEYLNGLKVLCNKLGVYL